jgi:hypothetical protein
MKISTEKGRVFDTDRPAKSNLIMVFDDQMQQKFDELKLTGKTTTVTEFGEKISMIEVEHSFGVDEINEDFLWQ